MNKNFRLALLLFVTIYKNSELSCCGDRFFAPRPKTPIVPVESFSSYNPFLTPDCLAYVAALAMRQSGSVAASRIDGVEVVDRAPGSIKIDAMSIGCSDRALSPCSPAYSPKPNPVRSK